MNRKNEEEVKRKQKTNLKRKEHEKIIWMIKKWWWKGRTKTENRVICWKARPSEGRKKSFDKWFIQFLLIFLTFVHCSPIHFHSVHSLFCNLNLIKLIEMERQWVHWMCCSATRQSLSMFVPSNTCKNSGKLVSFVQCCHLWL